MMLLLPHSSKRTTRRWQQVLALAFLQSLASLQPNQIMTLEQIGKDLATFGQELEAPLEPLIRKVSIQQ
jgi:hypothetical protein